MIRTRLQGDTPFFPNMLNNGKVEVCLKEDVDKVIAEKNGEIRRLRRALYKACANWAHAEFLWARFIDFKYPETWDEMERMCRDKAEEYR